MTKKKTETETAKTVKKIEPIEPIKQFFGDYKEANTELWGKCLRWVFLQGSCVVQVKQGLTNNRCDPCEEWIQANPNYTR